MYISTGLSHNMDTDLCKPLPEHRASSKGLSVQECTEINSGQTNLNVVHRDTTARAAQEVGKACSIVPIVERALALR